MPRTICSHIVYLNSVMSLTLPPLSTKHRYVHEVYLTLGPQNHALLTPGEARLSVTEIKARLSAEMAADTSLGAFVLEQDVWRCSICAWEIETDDGVKAYCRTGHQFDCNNSPDFKPCDEDLTETYSTVSSSATDEYEKDGLIDDEDVERPLKTLCRSMKDLDKSDCDKFMLIDALNKLGDTEDMFKVLVSHINSVEEVAGEFDDTHSNDHQESEEEDDTTLINKDFAADHRQQCMSLDIASDGEHESGSQETQEEDEDDTINEVDLEKPKHSLQLCAEDVTKMKAFWIYLTDIFEAAILEADPHLAEGQAIGRYAGLSESRASGSMIHGAEAEADEQPLEKSLLFDTTQIQTIIRRRDALMNDHETSPPSRACDNVKYEWVLDDLNEELFLAIQVARLARNEAKRDR